MVYCANSILLFNDLILYINGMSNILRSKNGNISKVKYFLSGCRSQNEEPVTIIGAKGTQSRSTNKKKSIVHHNHSQSVASNGDISFEIVGVH